jgi:hypothetical protein
MMTKKKKKKPFHETKQEGKLPYDHRTTRLKEGVNKKGLGAAAAPPSH